ncbi:MAG: hypothetical protein OSJ66_01915 [Clostridia bacterium]|nr:hypothetical protein [Clostridia bacterium]
MSELKRIVIDKFKIEDSFSFEDIEKGNYKIITMQEFFENFPKITLNSRKKELFLNGVMLTYELDDGVYNIYSEEQYIGLGIVKDRLLKRDIIE